jgi:regulator of protease activity HflC (stomatin/prohibitin superfamily)
VTALLVAVAVVLTLAGLLAGVSVRVLREYERAVVFRIGRLLGVRGPGLILLLPGVDRMVRVSLRTVTLNVPPQDIITRDNVPARVDAVVYFRVVDAAASVVSIENAVKATSQIAATTLRSVLGKAELDALLSERERLNEDLQQIIDDQTEPWGIKVSSVEIKDVGIPTTMQRAMARQAEAERERRAKVIHAEGEKQASASLSEAAGVLAQNPAAIQLRYLQTLAELGGEHNSTIVFPLPIDLIRPLLGLAQAVPQEAEEPAADPARLAAGPVDGALLAAPQHQPAAAPARASRASSGAGSRCRRSRRHGSSRPSQPL